MLRITGRIESRCLVQKHNDSRAIVKSMWIANLRKELESLLNKNNPSQKRLDELEMQLQAALS